MCDSKGLLATRVGSTRLQGLTSLSTCLLRSGELVLRFFSSSSACLLSNHVTLSKSLVPPTVCRRLILLSLAPPTFLFILYILPASSCLLLFILDSVFSFLVRESDLLSLLSENVLLSFLLRDSVLLSLDESFFSSLLFSDSDLRSLVLQFSLSESTSVSFSWSTPSLLLLISLGLHCSK